MVCLEKWDEMPAHKWEIDQAVEEGVIIHPSWGPLRIDAPTGSVRGIEFKRCTAVFDEQGRFNPRFDEDTTIYHEADTIILAIGQAMDTAFLNELGTLEVFRDRRIKADPVTGETTVKGFFAGGDVATGPKMAIDAIAQGQEAAESIIRYLEGMDLKEGRRASETKLVEDAPLYAKKGQSGNSSLTGTRENRLPGGLPDPYRGGGEEEAERCLNCRRCLDVRFAKNSASLRP